MRAGCVSFTRVPKAPWTMLVAELGLETYLLNCFWKCSLAICAPEDPERPLPWLLAGGAPKMGQMGLGWWERVFQGVAWAGKTGSRRPGGPGQLGHLSGSENSGACGKCRETCMGSASLQSVTSWENSLFTKAPKRIRYLVMNLMKESQNLCTGNYNTSQKKWFKDDLSKWEDIFCSWIGRFNSVTKSVLPKLVYRFNAVAIKLQTSFFG